MRRFWLPITILVVVVVSLLFYGGILTGQDYNESQNPYSRLVRVKGMRFGFPFETRTPNEMSAFYYNELKQPNKEYWVDSENAYVIERGRFEPTFKNPKVPPVTYLPSNIELAFLREIQTKLKEKNHKNVLVLGVIHSLYEPREAAKDKAAAARNNARQERERDRVNHIFYWYNVESKDFSVPFSDWWRDHASVFGLNQDGSKLSTSMGSQGR